MQTHASKSRLILVLLLTGQKKREIVKATTEQPGLISTFSRKFLYCNKHMFGIFLFTQHINTTDYRVCIKEIHKPNGYDPVKVATMMIGE